MMRSDFRCRSDVHDVTRRHVLETLAASATGLGLAAGSSRASALSKPVSGPGPDEKQILLLWLDGGMSQFESWDPKPGTQFGGPFRSIQTSLPGIRVSELMPRCAQQMHQLAVVRSMHTEDPNHSSGVPKILRGQPPNRGVVYPYMGSATARLMGPTSTGLPPYVWVKPGNGGFITKHAGFLGARYGALAIGSGKPPSNLVPPKSLNEDDQTERSELQKLLNRQYAQHRRPSWNEANTHVYDLARTLMKHATLFDQSTLPASEIERYGDHEFGRNTLLARRLIESGVRFVQVTSYGWDSHGDNFNAHSSRVPKVDQALSALLEDFEQRGLMDRVLLIVMAEFGRTPRINGSVGRDHWPNSWSLAMSGCGIQRGQVLGKTNPLGTAIVDEEHDIGQLFHTWYKAVGVDSSQTEFINGTQPLPIANDQLEPIDKLLV